MLSFRRRRMLKDSAAAVTKAEYEAHDTKAGFKIQTQVNGWSLGESYVPT
jgi:hypothetical protein